MTTTQEQNIETFILPAYWASAMVNGDLSGYDEEEINLIDNLLIDISEQYGHALLNSVQDEEQFFCKHHDAWYLMPLAADCLTFELVI